MNQHFCFFIDIFQKVIEFIPILQIIVFSEFRQQENLLRHFLPLQLP